jgi:urocanate hydratase
MVLQVEWDYYHEIKENLLVHSEGMYVLIKNRKVLGIFNTTMEAYKVGLSKLGNVPMLIQQILKEDPIVYI